MKISIYRHWRSSRFGWEWHNHAGVRWFHIWIGSPTHHRWWATSIFFYLPTQRAASC